MASSDQSISRREIANIQLFRGVPAAILDEARRSARLRIFAKNVRIFDQGDARIRAHALLDGSVRISQTGSDGAQIVIRFIGPGEIFGAAAAFTDRRYPADADAIGRSVEVNWSEADLIKLMQRHSQTALNALRIMGRRLNKLQNRVREVSTQSVERRVGHTMLRLVRQFGKEEAVGTTIGLPLRHKDIADIAGTTLYSVIRVLTSWEKRGLLVTRDQTQTVIKPRDLRALAEVIVD